MMYNYFKKQKSESTISVCFVAVITMYQTTLVLAIESQKTL